MNLTVLVTKPVLWFHISVEFSGLKSLIVFFDFSPPLYFLIYSVSLNPLPGFLFVSLQLLLTSFPHWTPLLLQYLLTSSFSLGPLIPSPQSFLLGAISGPLPRWSSEVLQNSLVAHRWQEGCIRSSSGPFTRLYHGSHFKETLCEIFSSWRTVSCSFLEENSPLF